MKSYKIKRQTFLSIALHRLMSITYYVLHLTRYDVLHFLDFSIIYDFAEQSTDEKHQPVVLGRLREFYQLVRYVDGSVFSNTLV